MPKDEKRWNGREWVTSDLRVYRKADGTLIELNRWDALKLGFDEADIVYPCSLRQRMWLVAAAACLALFTLVGIWFVFFC